MSLTQRFILPSLATALLLTTFGSFSNPSEAAARHDPGFKFGVVRTGITDNEQKTAKIWLTDKPISCNKSGSFQRIGAFLNAPNAHSVRPGIQLTSRIGSSTQSCANWQCKASGAIHIKITREYNNHVQGTWKLPKTGQKGRFNVKKCT